MDFEYSPRVRSLQAKLAKFFDEHIYPNEARYTAEVAENRRAGNAFKALRLIDELKPRARDAQLWNLFLPRSPRAPEGLSNLEYAPLCEIMGRVPWAPEVFNCAAPDTGNMETIERYGSEEQKDRWLEPLLAGADPLGLPDDRACSRVIGRHQHFLQHQARRQRLRDQRPQVVVERRQRSALQDLHPDGQDQSGRGPRIGSSR